MSRDRDHVHLGDSLSLQD